MLIPHLLGIHTYQVQKTSTNAFSVCSSLLPPIHPLLTTQLKQVTVNESHTSNIGFQKNNAINTPFPLQSTLKTLLRKGQIKWFIKKVNYTNVSKICAMYGGYLHILNTVTLVLSSSQISLGKMNSCNLKAVENQFSSTILPLHSLENAAFHIKNCQLIFSSEMF